MSDSTLEPGDKHLPPDIIEAFDSLCAAARVQHTLAVMSVKTPLGNQNHYVIAAMTQGGTHAIPIAILPTPGMSVGEFLKYFDVMSLKVGGAELDPEFKGVRQ